ncbi:MAG: 3-dehydroquinate dehydratase [Flavobacteriaceae bacterium]|nr:3-dehydroquinate dehydratase [Flavobacteriaceae bacterium]
MNIAILNGPNLNLLGKREPDVYGNKDFNQYFVQLQSLFPDINLTYFQSNVEGELINELQRVGFDVDGIILNAAAYTHTSVGIGDAIKAISAPVIEVHISNTFAREDFRHTSFVTPNAKGLILGFGLDVYRLAIETFLPKS